MKRLGWALALGILGWGLGAQALEIPITKVVLFTSGVGYFEHNGTVEGSAVARLPFKTDQINDVLKSMVLRDYSGGTVNAVTYASQDPLGRALKSFAVDLSGNPSLAGIMTQLRGAEVAVNAPALIQGKLVSVETWRKPAPGAQGQVWDETVLTILTAEGLKTVPLSSVSAFRPLDPKTADELARALALIAEAGNTQKKTVEIQFAGTGKRKVGIGYISEAPVWKTSYRLDLTGEKPFLQGWAIIENTTDGDWQNVSLSLVSGQPISFIQDLFTPFYIQRPVYRPQAQASLGPQSYATGRPGEPAKPLAAPAPTMGYAPERSRAAETMAKDSFDDLDGYAAADLRSSGVTSAATGAAAGELFKFNIKNSVTLARRQSAMLPLVQGEIKAEKLSIYNSGVSAVNPLNGVLLTNTTGLKLLGGPVTVFDEGMYSGDALFDNLGDKEKKLLSYGVDLNCTAETSPSQTSDITQVILNSGVLQVSRQTTYTQTYTFLNKGTAAKTLLVEHPANSSRKLVAPAAFEEKTPQVYRFRLTVAPGKTESLSVKETLDGWESMTLLSTRSANFLQYLTTGNASPAVKEALKKAAELKSAVETLQAKLSEQTSQKSSLENGQGRIRSNIETVGRDSPQGQRYLQKLLEDEDKIEALAKAQDQTRKDIDQAQKALEAYLKTLTVK